jgi:hypothetical protein
MFGPIHCSFHDLKIKAKHANLASEMLHLLVGEYLYEGYISTKWNMNPKWKPKVWLGICVNQHKIYCPLF